MDIGLRDRFIELWERYFPGAELPITFYYRDDAGQADRVGQCASQRCVFADLSRVRRGEVVAFECDSIGCAGGRRYLGFSQEIMPDFEYFLSCGIPGRVEGERYKQTPEMVRKVVRELPAFVAPKSHILFKRWDQLEERDDPAVVIFFADPDVLAGLFTLANYDEVDPQGVIAPSASGCGAIVMQPYLQGRSDHPRAVLGLFDPSARPFVTRATLTCAVPMGKFTRMVANMDQSFLITPTWERIVRRMVD